MKKILVPIDFTPASRNASEYAVSLARKLEAEVQLLHVYTEPMPVGNVPDPVFVATSLREENRLRVGQEMDWLKQQYGTEVSGSSLAGYRGDTIKDTAKEAAAELIVMGAKPAHKNKILGSTTLKMIRKSPKPVLIIPEEARFRPLKNIVLAIDFGEMVGSTVLDPLFQLADAFDSSVRVLHVEKKGGDMSATETAEKLHWARVLSRLTYTYDRVEYDDVDEGILSFVNGHPTDLLVMIAHHHSIFERLSNPIHTRTISFEIQLPLLVLKAPSLFE
jgi:nucleotide-binding universal stress UspA family protein